MCDSHPTDTPTLLSLLSILKDFPVRQYVQAACDTEGTSIILILCVCSFLEHSSDPSMKSTCAEPRMSLVLMTDVISEGSGEHCVCTICSLTKFKVDEDSSQIKILDIYVH